MGGDVEGFEMRQNTLRQSGIAFRYRLGIEGAPRRDSWMTVARLRAETKAANPLTLDEKVLGLPAAAIVTAIITISNYECLRGVSRLLSFAWLKAGSAAGADGLRSSH